MIPILLKLLLFTKVSLTASKNHIEISNELNPASTPTPRPPKNNNRNNFTKSCYIEKDVQKSILHANSMFDLRSTGAGNKKQNNDLELTPKQPNFFRKIYKKEFFSSKSKLSKKKTSVDPDSTPGSYTEYNNVCDDPSGLANPINNELIRNDSGYESTTSRSISMVAEEYVDRAITISELMIIFDLSVNDLLPTPLSKIKNGLKSTKLGTNLFRKNKYEIFLDCANDQIKDIRKRVLYFTMVKVVTNSLRNLYDKQTHVCFRTCLMLSDEEMKNFQKRMYSFGIDELYEINVLDENFIDEKKYREHFLACAKYFDQLMESDMIVENINEIKEFFKKFEKLNTYSAENFFSQLQKAERVVGIQKTDEISLSDGFVFVKFVDKTNNAV